MRRHDGFKAIERATSRYLCRNKQRPVRLLERGSLLVGPSAEGVDALRAETAAKLKGEHDQPAPISQLNKTICATTLHCGTRNHYKFIA